MVNFSKWMAVALVLGGLGAARASAQSLVLHTNALVDGEGVFLTGIATMELTQPCPPIRLSDAPTLGQALVLTRAQVQAAVAKAAPVLEGVVWSGADRVRITRRTRAFGDAELKEQLTAVLQRDQVRDQGELELRLMRPWGAIGIPDEPYTLKVLDLPTTGVTPNFIVRFQLQTARETLGPWQMVLQAKVWREVWVARSGLRREQLLSEADVVRERRDVLSVRDALLPISVPEGNWELAENVTPGMPLYQRSVRVRPVVKRGQVIEAHLQDGSLNILLKVEALESGAPGQLIRVRNLQTRREFRAKVEHEQLVQVYL